MTKWAWMLLVNVDYLNVCKHETSDRLSVGCVTYTVTFAQSCKLGHLLSVVAFSITMGILGSASISELL